MKRPALFILLNFLSSLGDTIFLAGVPLYFYQESSGSILETTFVPLAITISVLLAKKLILKVNKKNPILITAYGEFAMAGIEAVLLVAYLFFKSKWIILMGIVPLAVTYNFYAPAKFFQLQEYFFSENIYYMTTWQSAANHFGVLAGVFLSGFVVLRSGITGILFFDGATFVLFGLAMFVNRNQMAYSSATKTAQTNQNTELNFNFNIKFALIMISVFVLFSNWEQSSAVATAAKVTALRIDHASELRAILSGVGVCLGLLISRYFVAFSYRIWIFSILAVTAGLLIVAKEFPLLSSYILFFFGGVGACLALPVRKQVYRTIDTNGGDHNKVVSYQWVYNAALSFSLLPIGYVTDHWTASPVNALQIAGGSILLVGLLGGRFVYSGLKEALR